MVDNFERGLDAVKEEDKEDPFVQGMEKVYKQLMTTLEDGVTVRVPFLEFFGYDIFTDIFIFYMHDCIVEIRVEFLPYRFDRQKEMQIRRRKKILLRPENRKQIKNPAKNYLAKRTRKIKIFIIM